MFRSKAILVMPILAQLLSLCSSDSVPVSSDEGRSVLNGQGVVEGFVTLGGEAIGGVDIRVHHTSLAKVAVENDDREFQSDAKRGFYQLYLAPGTYELNFWYRNENPDHFGYGGRFEIVQHVTVNPDTTIRLDIELTGWGPEFYFKGESRGDRQVELQWEYGNAEGYDLYRTVDLEKWEHVSVDESRYTTVWRSYVDTVERYGTYYYKVDFVDRDSKTKYTSDTLKVTVERSFPAIDRSSLTDGGLFVSGRFIFENLLDTYHQIKVLRADGRAEDFQFVFQIPLQDQYASPFTSSDRHQNPLPYFEFKDILEPNLYLYRFIALDTVQNVATDTSKVYSIDFAPAPPGLQVGDSVTFVMLTVLDDSYRNLDDAEVIIYRSIDDTSQFIALDTIPVREPNRRYPYGTVYRDHTPPYDTLFYSVRWLYGNKHVGPRSRPERIVHTGRLAAPRISAVVDSGRMVYVEVEPAHNGAPVILYRTNSGDTIPVDTAYCSVDGGYRDRCGLMDSTGRSGWFSYVVAHSTAGGKIGIYSEERGVYATNKLSAPPLNLSSSIEGVELSIMYVHGANHFIVLRKHATDMSRQIIDTIPAPATDPDVTQAVYLDSTANFGYIHYTVFALDEEGRSGNESYVSLYYWPE